MRKVILVVGIHPRKQTFMSSSLIFPSLLGLVGVGGDNASLSRSSMSIREWCISPFALNFNLCLFYTVKMAQKSNKVEIGKKLTEWCKTLNSKADSNIFGKFWECTYRWYGSQKNQYNHNFWFHLENSYFLTHHFVF